MGTRFEYDKKRIGNKLRYYRKRNNLSAEYVRDYLKIGSVQAIYKWENGTTIPAVDNFLALMELYGIDSFKKLTQERVIFDWEHAFFVECFGSDKTYCVYNVI